jgi:hypothetical protein
MKTISLVLVLLSMLLTACSSGPAPAQPTSSPTMRPLSLGPWGFAPTVVPEETLVHITQWGGIEQCIYPEGLAMCSVTTIIGRDGRIRMLRGKWVTQDTRITNAELETLIAALDQVDGAAIQAELVPRHCELDRRTGVTFFTTAGRVDVAGCDDDIDRTRPPFSTIEPLLEKYSGR